VCLHVSFDHSVHTLQDFPHLQNFVIGTVVSINADSATLQSGQVIKFSYAAICTGSDYSQSVVKAFSGDGTFKSRRQEAQVPFTPLACYLPEAGYSIPTALKNSLKNSTAFPYKVLSSSTEPEVFWREDTALSAASGMGGRYG
jgi:hypothetical protein